MVLSHIFCEFVVVNSGMPVKEGEKYMTNLWIWDHKFSRASQNNN